MKRFFEKLWCRLNTPTPLFLSITYILTALFITGAMVMLTVGFEDSPLSVIAYALFALSAFSLTYTVYTIVIFAPDVKARILARIRKSPFLNRLVEQYSFRTLFFASLSFGINLVYVAFHIVISAISGSVWYASLAGYYILLTVMRGGIVFYHKKTGKGMAKNEVAELKKYKISGMLLVLMPICLSIAITEMVISKRGYYYPGFMIYAVAAYTFYKVTMAVINFIKARKNYGITIEAIRNIVLADALVSLLALQTSMFYSFGGDGVNSSIANALTGAAVCALTVAIGIVMLVNSAKYKRNLNDE